MEWRKKRGRPPDTRLLEHLLDVSGLPLEDLQFLAAAGMLSTCLHGLAGAGYTPEAWSVALTALYGRPVRLEDTGQAEQWLNAPQVGDQPNIPDSPDSKGVPPLSRHRR